MATANQDVEYKDSPLAYQQHKKKGMELYNEAKYEDALSEWNEAIRLNNDDSEIYNYKAMVFRKLKKYAEALDAYDKADEITRNGKRNFQAIGLSPNKSKTPNLKVGVNNRGKKIEECELLIIDKSSIDKSFCL